MTSIAEHLDYVLRAHRAITTPYQIEYFGDLYVIHPGVFSPVLTASTTTTAKAMKTHTKHLRGKTVLDMGCGAGVLGIYALRLGAVRSVGVDIAKAAIDNTRENMERLGVTEDMAVLQGDLFQPLAPGERYDLIIANLPLADRQVGDDLDRAFFDPEYRTIQRFLADAPNWLEPTGVVLLNYASIADIPKVVLLAEKYGLILRTVHLFDDYVFDHYVFHFEKNTRE